jgi:hypothetical protein
MRLIPSFILIIRFESFRHTVEKKQLPFRRFFKAARRSAKEGGGHFRVVVTFEG